MDVWKTEVRKWNQFLVVNFRNHYILKYEFYWSSSYRTTNVVTSPFKHVLKLQSRFLKYT